MFYENLIVPFVAAFFSTVPFVAAAALFSSLQVSLLFFSVSTLSRQGKRKPALKPVLMADFRHSWS